MITYVKRYDNLVVALNRASEIKNSDFGIRKTNYAMFPKKEVRTYYYVPNSDYAVDRDVFKKMLYFDRQLKGILDERV